MASIRSWVAVGIVAVGVSATTLGACRVDLEGAPCLGDGNCPEGQLCGGDGKCGENPAPCGAPAVDAIWIMPANVRPTGSRLTPTGAQTPPACRLATIGEALSARTTPTQKVVLSGGTVDAPAVFDEFTDNWTIDQPLTVVTEQCLDPASEVCFPGAYQVNFGQPTLVGGAHIRLEAGPVELAGFTVSSALGSIDSAIIHCLDGTLGTATAPITLRNLRLQGGGATPVEYGIRLLNGCGAAIRRVQVFTTKSTGILVDPAQATAPNAVSIVDSEIREAASFGAAVYGGTVRIAGTTLAGNRVGALLVAEQSLEVELEANSINQNQDRGLHFLNAGTAAPFNFALTLRDNDVFNNGNAAAPNLIAGGILFGGTGTLRAFERNTVRDNYAYQIGFTQPQAGGTAWNLTGLGCAAPNRVYCYRTTSPSLGGGIRSDLVSTGPPTVVADQIFWQNGTGGPGNDIQGSVQGNASCNSAPSTLPCLP
jgi:hypothetical protein